MPKLLLKLLLLPLPPPPLPKNESFNMLPFKQLVFKLPLEFIDAVIEAVIDDMVDVVILEVDWIIDPKRELPLIERGRCGMMFHHG